MKFFLLSSVLAWIGCAPAAFTQTIEVDLQLALGSDVSRSVDEEEAALQRQGYIRAFTHPAIADAISHGPLGRIAVMYFEWGGENNIRPVVDWSLIQDKKSMLAFAAKLSTDVPMSARRTGISGAIKYAIASIEKNRFSSRRKVIDLSGDGANNSGVLVSLARDEAIQQGFTINGLPIVNNRASGSGWQQVENLDLYYRDCVIGGPGAFYVVARDFKDFGRAIMRKLILEIANVPPSEGLFFRASFRPRKAPPCNIGEIRRRQRWGDWDDDDWVPMRRLQRPGKNP